MLFSLGLREAGESDMQTSEQTHDLTPEREDTDTDRNSEGEGSRKKQGTTITIVFYAKFTYEEAKTLSATPSVLILKEIWYMIKSYWQLESLSN